MISYAQNGEDVVLARALPSDSGCYVDVGAGDPDVASVTRHFYDLGWRGINVEPRAAAVARLRARRPEDITVQVAAGDSAGEGRLVVPRRDPDLASLRTAGDAPAEDADVEQVEVRTLDSILAEHRVDRIDFLKIDVEGQERSVLAGLDLDRYRPRVVVVECVEPWSRVRTDHLWRDLLEDRGYKQAGFDGVNLYFAAADNTELMELLASPASILDDYRTAAAVAVQQELDRVTAYTRSIESELAAHRDEVAELRAYVGKLEQELAPAASAIAHAVSPAAVPPPLVRFAVLGTPRTGNTWVRRVLADALGATEVAEHHPADIAWDSIPNRVAIQLHWPRTALLERALRQNGVAVLSVARHPLDVLLSVLHFAEKEHNTRAWLAGRDGDEQPIRGVTSTSAEFLAWATGPRAESLLSLTVDWWQRPSTVRLRYESLVADPEAEFSAVLDRLALNPVLDIATAVGANNPRRLSDLSGGVHVWRARPGAWREELPSDAIDRLMDAHAKVIAALGYDPDDRSPAPAAEA